MVNLINRLFERKCVESLRTKQPKLRPMRRDEITSLYIMFRFIKHFGITKTRNKGSPLNQGFDFMSKANSPLKQFNNMTSV